MSQNLTPSPLQAAAALAFTGDWGSPDIDLDAEIRRVWKEHPGSREKVLFFELPAGGLVYPDNPVKQRELAEWLTTDPELQSIIKRYSDRKSSGRLPLTAEGNLIMLYTADDGRGLFERVISPAQKLAFFFDHELAHALIPDATRTVDPNLAECIADAYAVIRHFQRFGTETGGMEGLSALRAARFIFREPDDERGLHHFTSPVVDQLLARRDTIDWNSLTPKETLKLAREAGMAFAPHRILLKRMDEALKDCHVTPETVAGGDGKALTKLMALLQETASPQVMKYGALALDFFSREAESLPGAAAQRHRIDERRAFLETRDELLFGLGAPQAAQTKEARLAGTIPGAVAANDSNSNVTRLTPKS